MLPHKNKATRYLHNAPMPMQCFTDVKVNLKGINLNPIKKFLLLVLSRTTIMLQHLTVQVLLYYLSSSRLQEVKNKGKFQVRLYL